VWWNTPAILALGRLRQENHKFKARLGCRREILSQNKKKENIKCDFLFFVFIKSSQVV
jgi:hypothetical protein